MRLLKGINLKIGKLKNVLLYPVCLNYLYRFVCQKEVTFLPMRGIRINGV